MGPRAEALERRFERPMLVAAALVIPALILESAESSGLWNVAAETLNWGIWLAFFGELVTMLVVVDGRWRYLRHNPLRIAIVVLTPPFLPAVLQGLRVARLLKLLRLLALAPIFKVAFSLRGLKYASAFTLLVVATGAAGYENAEPDKDYFDGIYWAMTTITTVGYGDQLPTTVESKIIAMTLMLIGIGYAAVVTGAIAERFMEHRSEEAIEALTEPVPDDLDEQVDRLALRVQELGVELEALRRSMAARR